MWRRCWHLAEPERRDGEISLPYGLTARREGYTLYVERSCAGSGPRSHCPGRVGDFWFVAGIPDPGACRKRWNRTAPACRSAPAGDRLAAVGPAESARQPGQPVPSSGCARSGGFRPESGMSCRCCESAEYRPPRHSWGRIPPLRYRMPKRMDLSHLIKQRQKR